MQFRSLVIPVFIAVFISFAAFVALVVFAAAEQDRAAFTAERAKLEHDLQGLPETLLILASDNARWDVAVQSLYFDEDVEWAAITLGDSVNSYPAMDGVVVVQESGRILYEVAVRGTVHGKDIVQQLAPLLNQMNINDGVKYVEASGYFHSKGRVISFGASMVRPSGGKNMDGPLPDRMPIIIFFSELTQERLEALSQISDSILVSGEEKLSQDKAAVFLRDYSGRHVAHIFWQPATPGSQMAIGLSVPSGMLLLLIIAAFSYFIRQVEGIMSALDQANRSKSAFLANMSHEIRTPLNSILGFTELVSMELFGKVEGDKNKEYLALIRGSGQHLLAVINDILDLSKLEAGKFSVHAEEIAPAEIAENCINFIEPSAHDKDIKLVCKCEDGTILSDERIMRQILLNLLSNAIKFTRSKGNVQLLGVREKDHYKFTVKDTGIGMTPDQIEVALSVFGQVENEYERTHSGTGLGLPIVDRFIRLLGGQMLIHSTPGVGTSVTLTLPIKNKRKYL